MPNRVSLPSMLPPACVADAAWSTPSERQHGIAGLLRDDDRRPSAARRSRASRRAPPSPGACRGPCGRTCSRARAGISRIASTSRKFESGVGFSSGCAEFALKKPPPFVPSCLIAIWLAAGPSGTVCSVTTCGCSHGLARRIDHGIARGVDRRGTSIVTGSSKLTVRYGAKLCTTPCDISTTASTNDSGSKMYSVLRVRSTQKLPIVGGLAPHEAADQRHEHGHAASRPTRSSARRARASA